MTAVRPTHPPAWHQAVFVLGAVASLWNWEYAPQAALLLGIVLALAGITPFEKQAKKLSRVLIQACVIILGLRLDLHQLYEGLRHGGVLAIVTVFGTLAAGLLLGLLLKTQRVVSLLVSAGTAICGGSAIAAVGAAIGAASAAMAVATGAIFVLNAVGLFVLPPLGHALHLSDEQFGTWAGIALHDIASVGGAGRAYEAGAVAENVIQTAMIVKLTRVVFIMPMALAAQRWYKPADDGTDISPSRGASAPFPWFILGFLGASALVTFFPVIKDHVKPLMIAKDSGFQLALFLIGSGVSRAALASVGWRALVQAVVLWVLIAGGSLWAVKVFV